MESPTFRLVRCLTLRLMQCRGLTPKLLVRFSLEVMRMNRMPPLVLRPVSRGREVLKFVSVMPVSTWAMVLPQGLVRLVPLRVWWTSVAETTLTA